MNVPSMGVEASQNVMTIPGTINKTAILLILALLTASFVWGRFFAGETNVMPFVLVGGIGGFILALVTVFKLNWCPITAPLYALLEGLFLGGISAMFEMQFPGIVIQAVGLTLGVTAAMLMMYRTGIIKPTAKFKAGIFAATGGIFLFYLISMVLGFFGVGVPLIHSSGPLGIGFSLVVVVIASMNLILDFDIIEQGSKRGAPKFMEWYGAFALMVTLVWLYIEILRLLSKLRRR